MNKRPLTHKLAAATICLTGLLPLSPTLAQDAPKVRREGKIEMSIDPNSPGFDADKLEKQIRGMIEGMDLSKDQKAQLDESLKSLRDNLKPGPDGKAQKFNWKFEYKGDGDGDDAPKPKIKPQQPNGANEADDFRKLREQMQKRLGGAGGDFFRQFMGDDGQIDPDKMMKEMLKQMGIDPNDAGQFRQNGPNGQKRFFFRFGPNGLEKGGEEGGDENGGNLQDELRKQFGLDWGQLGGHDHGNFDPDKAPRNSKYSRSTLAEYRDVIREVRKSTIAILKEGHQVALGAVVSPDGYAITKASEVAKGNLECEFMDGAILPAKVVSKDETYDVALIKIDGAKDLKPVSFKTADLPVGTMLAASGIDENPISVGVVSVPPRNLDESQKGFLGLATQDSPNGKGVIVGNIVPDSPAAKTKLKVEDTILSVDGEAVDHATDLVKKISGKAPGDKVKLNVDGKGDIEITLSSREEFARELTRGIDPTAQMGSALSGKSSGFPNAIQNDLGINANQCGGPVADIDGNVVGINIARSGRTSTYMLSGKIAADLISDAKSGKLSIVKDPASLARDIKKYEAETQRLHEALKAAEEKLKAARDAGDQKK